MKGEKKMTKESIKECLRMLEFLKSINKIEEDKYETYKIFLMLLKTITK